MDDNETFSTPVPRAAHDDDYELVRHDKLDYLRHEVEKLEHNPFGDTQSSKDLLTAMDALNKNVSKLVQIFETANDEIVRDYKDQAHTEKLNRVLEQNEKLAKGIVAIAELLKEVKGWREEVASSNQPPKENAPTPPPGPLSQPPGRPGPQPGTGQEGAAPIDFSDVPLPPSR